MNWLTALKATKDMQNCNANKVANADYYYFMAAVA